MSYACSEPCAANCLLRFVQSEIITLYVGPKRKKYLVHKDLLCAKSKYFVQTLDSRWKEGQTAEVFWDDEDVDAVQAMIDWLYGQRFNVNLSRSDYIEVAMLCYKLGDERLMPEFKNVAMDAIRHRHRLKQEELRLSLVIEAKERGVVTRGCALYKYLIRLAAYIYIGTSDNRSKFDIPQSELLRLCNDSELVFDVLEELAQYRGSVPFRNPAATSESRCLYHDHSDGSSCK